MIESLSSTATEEETASGTNQCRKGMEKIEWMDIEGTAEILKVMSGTSKIIAEAVTYYGFGSHRYCKIPSCYTNRFVGAENRS